jgi:thioredoxin reductase
VKVLDGAGKEESIEADTVILAAGIRADAEQTELLRGLVDEYYVIGDGRQARRIMQAVAEGYNAAADLSLPVR